MPLSVNSFRFIHAFRLKCIYIIIFTRILTRILARIHGLFACMKVWMQDVSVSRKTLAYREWRKRFWTDVLIPNWCWFDVESSWVDEVSDQWLLLRPAPWSFSPYVTAPDRFGAKQRKKERRKERKKERKYFRKKEGNKQRNGIWSPLLHLNHFIFYLR